MGQVKVEVEGEEEVEVEGDQTVSRKERSGAEVQRNKYWGFVVCGFVCGFRLIGGEAGQAEFFENNFYLQGIVEAAMLIADSLLVRRYPLLHGFYANAIDGGKFCKGAGLDLRCLDCAGHGLNFFFRLLYILITRFCFYNILYFACLMSFGYGSLGFSNFFSISSFFFASPKKNQKRSPTKDYIPFVGWYPD